MLNWPTCLARRRTRDSPLVPEHYNTNMLAEDFPECEFSGDLLKTTDEKNQRDCAHLKIKIHIQIKIIEGQLIQVQIFTLKFWIRNTVKKSTTACTWSTILLKTGVTPRTEICGKPIPRMPSNLQKKCSSGSIQNLKTYVSSAAVGKFIQSKKRLKEDLFWRPTWWIIHRKVRNKYMA